MCVYECVCVFVWANGKRKEYHLPAQPGACLVYLAAAAVQTLGKPNAPSKTAAAIIATCVHGTCRAMTLKGSSLKTRPRARKEGFRPESEAFVGFCVRGERCDGYRTLLSRGTSAGPHQQQRLTNGINATRGITHTQHKSTHTFTRPPARGCKSQQGKGRPGPPHRERTSAPWRTQKEG